MATITRVDSNVNLILSSCIRIHCEYSNLLLKDYAKIYFPSVSVLKIKCQQGSSPPMDKDVVA